MNQHTTYPSIAKTPYSPGIKNHGLVITFSETESNRRHQVIQGVFALPKKQDNKYSGKPHNAITTVINFDGRYVVVQPFKNIVVFADDIAENRSTLFGYFQFNVLDYFDYINSGNHYVLCSLGLYLSNTLKIPMDFGVVTPSQHEK